MAGKKWDTPKLIVLARGKPEEGILQGCKNATNVASSGASQARVGCRARTGGTCPGGDCSSTLAS